LRAAMLMVATAFARNLAKFPVCCSTTCSWSCSRLAGGVLVVVAPPSHLVHSRLRHRTNSAVMTLPSQRRPAMARRHAAVVCTDYTTAAVTFFSNVRVPATLVAATAIKEAFVLVSVPRDLAASQGWRILRRCYTLLMLFSFSEELSCVFISTGAMMLLQSGTLDTKAPSLVALLVRELEYEYVSVRHHFITGVLSLMFAQALRARQALRYQPALARAAMFAVCSSAASLLTYSNARTITYGGYAGMALRFCVLHLRLMASYARLAHPLALIGIASSVLALVFAIQATHEPTHAPPEERRLGWGLEMPAARRPVAEAGLTAAEDV